VNDKNAKAVAGHATQETRDLLRFIKDRADQGDLMMHLIAEHIEKLEAKLKQYAERTNVFS
jgi:hypothetical protein